MGVSGVDAPEQSPRSVKWLGVHHRNSRQFSKAEPQDSQPLPDMARQAQALGLPLPVLES